LDLIVTVIQNAWSIISGVFDIIKNVLSGDFTEAWQSFETMISDVFTNTWNFIKNTVQNIIDFFTGDAATNLANAIWDAFKGVFDTVSGWMRDILEAVGSAIIKVVDFFLALPGEIYDAFIGFDLWGLGWDLIQGLINGITDKAKDLVGVVNDWVVNPVKDAISGIGGFLFGSPSKWMAQRGKWLTEGLADGMMDAKSLAVNAAVNLADATKSPFESSAFGTGVDIPGLMGRTAQASPNTSAGGTNVTLLAGAVSVSIGGNASEAEAARVGEAVGYGILDVIARRDARVQVRMI